MAPAHSQSCPNCAFLHNDAGNSQARTDDLMVCLQCNTKWREIIKPASISSSYSPIHNKSLHTNINLKLNAVTMPSALQTQASSFAAKYIILATVFVFTAFSFFFSRAYFQNTPLAQEPTPPALEIAEISINNLHNAQLQHWRISGKVFNNSNNYLHIPPIRMQADNKGSGGYFNFTYKPALQTLAPGASFRFRISVHKPVGSADNIVLKFVNQHQRAG